MYHWIRDTVVSDRGGSDDAGYGTCSYLIYHFLRTAGWSWLWECDSQGEGTNHVVDGSMQASGTTNWTVVGTASLSKTNSTRHMGDQSLQVTSAALNDGARSAAMQNMVASTQYYLSIWAANDTGPSWQVEVDVGGGTFASVGSIPDNSGVWTRHEFTFTTDGSANNRYFRVLDNNGATASIYIDSVMCYQSFFEHNGVDAEDLSGTPDGQILNSNEFSSASYTFVAGDVGKHVCVWDTTNVGNSGAYTISSISGSNAVLDLRAGGSPALTSQTGLRWRMCDTSVAPRIQDAPEIPPESWCGWGLESPHSESWRFFCRNQWTTINDRGYLVTWSCPYDGDFNVDTGEFFPYEARSEDVYGEFSPRLVGTITAPAGAVLAGALYTIGSISSQRVYLQTDDDCTALFIALRPADAALNAVGHVVVGFSGADSVHTLRESFIHFGKIAPEAINETTMHWNNNGRNSFLYGAQCSEGDVGHMITSSIPLLMIGTSNTTLREYSNQRINPFNSERYLAKFVIMRDFYGYAAGQPTQKTLDTLGLWSGELVTDLNYVGVENDTMLHFVNGVYMELPSSGGVGLFTPLA